MSDQRSSVPAFDIVEHASTILVRLSGRLDTTQCTTLQAPLFARLSAGGQSLIFDLEEVTFAASAFVRLCIIAARIVGEDRLRLINVSPMLKRVFRIAGLDNHVQVAGVALSPPVPAHEPVYPVTEAAAAGALISRDRYQSMYARSIADPIVKDTKRLVGFWG